MVRLIDKKIGAVKRHAVLYRLIALTGDAARCNDHLTATKRFVNLRNVVGDVFESTYNRIFRGGAQNGAAQIFEDAERKELFRNLRTQGVSGHYDKEFGADRRNKDCDHCVSFAGTGGHDDGPWRI